MVVYVDVAFALNFAIDACLLLMTSSLLRKKASLKRLFSAAAIGSIYAVITLFPGTALFRGFFVKWLCSVVMVDLTFSLHWFRKLRWLPKRWTKWTEVYRESLHLFKFVGAFYGVTFAAGGAVYGLHSLFAPGSSAFSGLALVDGRVVWWTSIATIFTVFAIPIGMMSLRTFWSLSTRLRRDQQYVFPFTVSVGSKTVTMRALLDTGNSLIDPITKIPVAVVQSRATMELLPPMLKRAVESGADPLKALYDAGDDLEHLAHRISVVPYRGVGGQGGYLLAFRPDDAVIVEGNRHVSVMPILCALQKESLSKLSNYDCILPASVAEVVLGEGRESVVDTRSHAPSGEASRTTHSA